MYNTGTMPGLVGSRHSFLSTIDMFGSPRNPTPCCPSLVVNKGSLFTHAHACTRTLAHKHTQAQYVLVVGESPSCCECLIRVGVVYHVDLGIQEF